MAVGKLFHIIHMTGTLPALEAWYSSVFGVRIFQQHNYMPGEKRDASLVILGDCVIEPLAPAFRVQGWDTMPLGRFYQRFSNHWHSIAFYTDDAADIWQRCTDSGIRVYVEGGVAARERPAPNVSIVTHPKDTFTQLEFMNPEGTPLMWMDPRLAEDWDSKWWIDNHPLGLEGLAYATVLTRDRQRALHVFTDVLGGKLLHEEEAPLTGTHGVFVLLGDTVVELATVIRGDTLAAQDAAANGDILHAATFKVVDLDRAENHLHANGIKTLDRDESTLITDPATTHGAVFRWTTRDILRDSHFGYEDLQAGRD